jgi:copper chaperone
MTLFSIPDMSCGHCKAAVEAAVASVDPGAQVRVDLPGRRAEVESRAPLAALIAALAEAGYPAEAG